VCACVCVCVCVCARARVCVCVSVVLVWSSVAVFWIQWFPRTKGPGDTNSREPRSRPADGDILRLFCNQKVQFPVHKTPVTSFQRIIPSPRPCVRFRNTLILFYGEELLGPTRSLSWRTTACLFPLLPVQYVHSYSSRLEAVSSLRNRRMLPINVAGRHWATQVHDYSPSAAYTSPQCQQLVWRLNFKQ
jgi:hypothetical protein